MVPLCSMVPLDTQASWLMECLLLLVWPSIQRIPVEMLLWPRCQGQRGVTWVTTFFYETDSYCFFTKSVFFFEMVKVRSCRSGWVQIAPSVLIWYFWKPLHLESIPTISCVNVVPWLLREWSEMTFFLKHYGYWLPPVLGKGQGRGQKTEVDVPWHFDAIIIFPS